MLSIGAPATPLPLELATTLQSHVARAGIELSPDGQWLAHTYSFQNDLAMVVGHELYTATGVTLAEGSATLRAELVQTHTGETVRLGDADSSSWDPVWAADGKSVAFYSDQGGEAGLWKWDLSTRKATRFPGVTARPFFAFEQPVWMRGGRQILCKILPQGMTLGSENRLSERSNPRHFETLASGASVFTLRAGTESRGAEPPTTSPPRTEPPPAGYEADLALLDLDTLKVTRIAAHSHPRWYAPSPDGKYIGYTDLNGWEANAQQAVYDIKTYELATGITRTLAAHARMEYGIELNWSPDSRHLAYIESGQSARGKVIILSGDSDPAIEPGTAAFGIANGKHALLWNETSDSIYAIAIDGTLWRVDAASGRAAMVSAIPKHRIVALIGQASTTHVWSAAGNTGWVIAKETDSSRMSIYKVDLKSGAAHATLEETRTYLGHPSLDASETTGEIAYVAADQHHTADVWLLNTRSGQSRRLTHLNPALDTYALGTARLLRWSVDGQELKGTLLLPAGYQQGQKVPLLVWIYGGQNGSEAMNTFGLWNAAPAFNFQILATRGYAILYPDAPLHVGTTSKDLFNSVMPGVDAAIAQGYADPDRLAIAGQSYGSYCTLALITQTPRFKAAIISAVLHPDFMSAYLGLSPDGTDLGTGYFEHGQGNMGGTPWQYPQRYLANSPIFAFDKIQTPLLIVEGDQDGELVAGANAVFVALRRLNKEVEYRTYEGEGHMISHSGNVIDFWQRRISFLDEHMGILRDDAGKMAQ